MFKHGFRSIFLASALFFVVSVAWATGVAEPGSQGYTVYTGAPFQERTQTLHVQGKEVQVYEMITYLHIMNVPTGRQPIDFPADFLLEEDSTTGHTAFCKSSFDQTLADERASKPTDRSYAVLQVNLDRTYSEVTTDEGVVIYPDRSVSCWEAIDPRTLPQQ
jgi:hypothetical protein